MENKIIFVLKIVYIDFSQNSFSPSFGFMPFLFVLKLELNKCSFRSLLVVFLVGRVLFHIWQNSSPKWNVFVFFWKILRMAFCKESWIDWLSTEEIWMFCVFLVQSVRTSTKYCNKKTYRNQNYRWKLKIILRITLEVISLYSCFHEIILYFYK